MGRRLSLRFNESAENRILWDMHRNCPIGTCIANRIAKEPPFSEKLTRAAWASYDVVLPSLDLMKLAIDYKGLNLTHLMAIYSDIYFQMQQSSMDMLFHHDSYKKALLRNLDARYSRNGAKADIIMTEAAPSGASLTNSHYRTKLLHIAFDFGLHSTDPNAYSYLDFGWGWYRENQIPLNTGFSPDSTEQSLRADLGAFLKREGMHEMGKEDGFHHVRQLVLALRQESVSASNAAREARLRIVSHAKIGKEGAVQALVNFAGQVFEINEAIHVFNCKLLNMLVLCMEARGKKFSALKKQHRRRNMQVILSQMPKEELELFKKKYLK